MLRYAVITSLLALPLPASASIGEDQPLRTLCSSPTMDYCMSIWTFDFEFSVLAVMNDVTYYTLNGTAKTEAFGAGFDSFSGGPSAFLLRFTPPTLEMNQVAVYQLITGPGVYNLSATGEGPFYEVQRNPLLEDLEFAGFFGVEGATCRVGECYEPVSVPEPASMLLLTTGSLGVAWVRRRRRLSN